MPIWSRCRTSAKKSGGWSSIERLILCMICLLWAVKRHSPRLAGKHRQIPSFTMSMSGTHAQSRGETRRGRPGKSRRMHNGWLGVPAFAKAPARQPSYDGLARTKLQSSEGWWSQTGSNRRPQACKASALPTELWPPRGSVTRSQGSGKGSSRSLTSDYRSLNLVGLGRVELPTSRLSSARSNQLSYRPGIQLSLHYAT